jgi:hypothetical protein
MGHPLREMVDAALDWAKAGEGRKLGLAGCPGSGAGGSGPGGCGDLRRDNGTVEWLIPKSPRLALARALQVDMVPFEFVIQANFAAAGQVTLTDQGPAKPISRDVLLYGIDVDIQNPAGFTADELKPLSDFFYDITSGIQAAINIYGDQRRRMTYFPLRAVPKLCSPEEPWCVFEEQIPSMDFTTTTDLPFAGMTVFVTFIGKTPSFDTTYRMSPSDAFCALEELGYCVEPARRLWGC